MHSSLPEDYCHQRLTLQTLEVFTQIFINSSYFSDFTTFLDKIDNCCDGSIPELQRHLSYPDSFNKRLEMEIYQLYFIFR